jgi:hypothetical protein
LKSIAEDFERHLATAAEMLSAEGMTDAAGLLRTSMAKVKETGHDNWNGGTTIWTIYLIIKAAAYAQLGTKRETLEEQINNRLKPILEQFTGDWYSVTIAPRVESHPDPEWRYAKGEVSHTSQVKFTERTRDDRLRQPVLLGIGEDKNPKGAMNTMVSLAISTQSSV